MRHLASYAEPGGVRQSQPTDSNPVRTALRSLGRCGAVLTVGGLALALAACGGSKKPPVVEKPPVEKPLGDPADLDPSKASPSVPIKVALLLPLSGRFGSLGKAMQRAAEMAVFETGSKNLQLIPLDTGGTAEGASAAATQALNAGAKLIVGPLFRDAVEAVKQQTAESGINIIAFSNSPQVAGGNVFLLSFLLKQQVDRIVQYAAEQNVREIAVLAPAGESGQNIVDYARDAAARNNASVTRVGLYQGNITKMQEQIKAFTASAGLTRKGVAIRRRALDFSGLIIHASGARLRTLTSLLAFYDVDPDKIKFLGTGRWDHPSTRAEPSLKGGWFASPPPDLRDRFVGRYEEAHGKRPPRIASLAYDAIALAAVLGRSATAEDENPYTVEALTDPSGFIGVDGLFRFTRDGLSERGLAVLEVTPEEFRIVGEAPRNFLSPTTDTSKRESQTSQRSTRPVPDHASSELSMAFSR